MSLSVNNVGAVNTQPIAFGNATNPITTERKEGMSTGTKVAIAATLTALATTGIYLATKGKVKPNVAQRVMANGNKFTSEVSSDGSRKILKMLDKDGKVLKQKTTETHITATGKKIETTTRKGYGNEAHFDNPYIQAFAEKGPVETEVKRYFSKDNKLILKTVKYTANNGDNVVAKYAPLDGVPLIKGQGDFLLKDNHANIQTTANMNMWCLGIASTYRVNSAINPDASKLFKVDYPKYFHVSGQEAKRFVDMFA